MSTVAGERGGSAHRLAYETRTAPALAEQRQAVPAFTSFGACLKAFREAAGFTQDELATIAGLSVHAVSALERGERKRPHLETLRALAGALDLSEAARETFLASARAVDRERRVDPDVGGETSLPIALTSVIGRDAEVQTLRRWLSDPAVRLITLTGPGGAGKTRLAVELAGCFAAERVARVVFVSLAAIRHPAYVASAIAEALGIADLSAGDLARRARLACADRLTLLVLDNFEHVLDASSVVADLVSSVPALRLLATSRAPLRVRGEREYVVGPLAVPDESCEDEPAALARYPAVRLFIERVRDVQPGFRLTPVNARTITHICRRLDALPLALELAAPWMKVLPAEDLLRRLKDDVLLSTAGPRDLPERQQTINATVAWSYQLLDSDERGVFRRLGALPGRFPVGAAAAVLRGAHRSVPRCTETLQSLAGLIDRSLLSKAESTLPNRPVFQMLETVRAYAALELSASGEREDAMEGMAAYCIREASAAGDGLVGPAQLDWLNRVRDDLDLYRGALAWLIERGRAAEASQIASNLLFFWVIRGHAAEGLRWLEQILSVPSLPQAAESHALAVAGMLRYTQGELGPAREALERACLIAERAGDGQTHVRAQSLLGHVEHASGHLKAARERFAASVEGSRALSMPWSTGIALAGLAWVALATGDLDESERLLDESDSSLQVAGPWFLLLSLYIRAVLSVRRGDPDQAIKLAHQSLARISELHDKFAFVYALVPLAAAAVRKGDSAWAARILGAGEVMSEQTGAMMVDQSVLDLHRQTEREARMRLGPSRWEREHAAGRRASVESLLKEIERAVNTA